MTSSSERLPLSLSGLSALEVAKRVVLGAGETIARSFRQAAVDVRAKGRGDLVTNVDVQVERESRALLAREFPSHGFLGEEGGTSEGASPYLWIMDPVDGTGNFATGIPHFCTTLALMRDSVAVLGVTYDPIRQDLFIASEGQGTTVNGRATRVRGPDDLGDASIGLDVFPADEAAVRRSLAIAGAAWPAQRLRLMGSAALGVAYVAAGWLDVYFHVGLKPWDVAAGLALVREAGGTVLDFHGAEADAWSRAYVAAGNRGLARALLERAT